jgi:hypothetical protein
VRDQFVNGEFIAPSNALGQIPLLFSGQWFDAV